MSSFQDSHLKTIVPGREAWDNCFQMGVLKGRHKILSFFTFLETDLAALHVEIDAAA